RRLFKTKPLTTTESPAGAGAVPVSACVAAELRRLISARGPLLDCLRGSGHRDRARKRGEEEVSNHVGSMPGNSARPKCRASEASTADAKISTPAPRIASSGPVGALPAPSLWRTL